MGKIKITMFRSDTQDDCATSDEELMSLHGDSSDEYLQRSIVFNPTKNLEDSKFKFALFMILVIASGQLRYNSCFKKKKTSSSKRMKAQDQGHLVRCQIANGSYLHERLVKMNLSRSRQ